MRAVTNTWDRIGVIGVGLVKSLNQGLLPISLNLISNGIKEILTKKNTNIIRNIYLDLMIKMLSANKRKLFIIIFFQISALCISVCAYMHATFLAREIADRFLDRALYG